MKKIASFEVDHLRLLRGLYVSRHDPIGNEWVTTFDIRMKAPNREPVLDMPALHSIEHLGATWLRNHRDWGEKVIYFGPMGCRTGCYLLVHGRYESEDVLALLIQLFQYIADFRDAIPGASDKECGNCFSHDLPMAAWESRKFLEEVLKTAGQDQLHYS